MSNWPNQATHKFKTYMHKHWRMDQTDWNQSWGNETEKREFLSAMGWAPYRVVLGSRTLMNPTHNASCKTACKTTTFLPHNLSQTGRASRISESFGTAMTTSPSQHWYNPGGSVRIFKSFGTAMTTSPSQHWYNPGGSVRIFKSFGTAMTTSPPLPPPPHTHTLIQPRGQWQDRLGVLDFMGNISQLSQPHWDRQGQNWTPHQHYKEDWTRAANQMGTSPDSESADPTVTDGSMLMASPLNPLPQMIACWWRVRWSHCHRWQHLPRQCV